MRNVIFLLFICLVLIHWFITEVLYVFFLFFRISKTTMTISFPPYSVQLRYSFSVCLSLSFVIYITVIYLIKQQIMRRVYRIYTHVLQSISDLYSLTRMYLFSLVLKNQKKRFYTSPLVFVCYFCFSSLFHCIHNYRCVCVCFFSFQFSFQCTFDSAYCFM